MNTTARRLLRTAGLGELAPFLSPHLFSTLAPGDLGRTVRELGRARLTRAENRAAQRAVGARLAEEGAPVEFVGRADGCTPEDLRSRRARGHAVLWLYFRQLRMPGPVWLDLRQARFDGAAPVRWAPGWMRTEWSRDFREAIGDLYAGFYGEEPARFEAALEPLGIAPARDVFLGHFGAGDQRAVRFSADAFRATFTDAFVACRDAGTQLHPDFVPLGLMLTSLYLHLEALDLPLDVRSAWQAANGPQQSAA